MTQATVRVVNFTAPSGGVYPQQQTIPVPSGVRLTGMACKGYLIFLGGGQNLDTIETSAAHARLSCGMWDGTTARAAAFFGEHAVAAASADTGYRVDTATVVQQTLTTGEGLNSEATPISLGVDEIVIEWSADPGGRRGFVVMLFGIGVTCKVSSSASSSSAGGTVNVTPGFVVDWFFAFSVGQNFVADGSGGEGMLSLGFAGRLPSSTQACGAIVGEDRQSNTSSGTEARSDAFAVILQSAAAAVTQIQRLDVSAWSSSDGFTVRSNAALAVEVAYFSVSFGGKPAVANAADNAGTTSTGSLSSTTPGFRAIALCMLGMRTAVDAVANVNGGMSIAWTDGVTTGCIGVHFRDNQTTSEATTFTSETEIVATQSNATTGFDWKAAFTSIDATGWTINVNDAAAATRCIPFLAVGRVDGDAWLPEIVKRRHRTLVYGPSGT